MYSYGPPHMAKQKLDDQLEHTYSSSLRIRVVALKTWQRRWTIGRSGERGSGISVLTAQHDDVDDEIIRPYMPFLTTTTNQIIFPNICKASSSTCRAIISLTLSCHPSLSPIASSRSSGLHPVSTQSHCM